MKHLDFQHDILPLKDKIFRMALRIVLDRQEAEDITQDTLVRVWERRDEWHQIENMGAWCLTIARRLALDHTKGQGARSKEQVELSNCEIANSDNAVDEILDQRQRVEAVRRLMDELPEVQRTVMQLRDVEGMRYDEIANITGLTESQVKVYLHRARKKIRETL